MTGQTLPASEAFAIACKHVLSDGVVDVVENEMLRRLSNALSLPPPQALDIAREVRDRTARHDAHEVPCAEPQRILKEVLLVAQTRSERRALGPADRALIRTIADALGIPEPLVPPATQPDRGPIDLRDERPSDEPESPPASWTRWPSRFWSRPLFTLSRLMDSSSAYRKARAIRGRIAALARRAPSATLLRSVVDRVQAAAEILWDIDEELEQIVQYLSRRGRLVIAATRPARRNPSALDEMNARRLQLAAAVARMVSELEQLEDKVAAYALARPDGLPRRVEAEVEQALSELEIVATVMR